MDFNAVACSVTYIYLFIGLFQSSILIGQQLCFIHDKAQLMTALTNCSGYHQRL